MSMRSSPPAVRSTPTSPLPHVERTRNSRGQVYLYYRRGGQRIPLPQPEGSAAFLAAYDQAHASMQRRHGPEASGRHTVGDAVTAYLASADYQQLAPTSRADYRRTLDQFRGAFGELSLKALDEGWIEELRSKHADRPITWNGLRSRMIVVVRLYRRLHPGALPANPWEASRRLKVEKSNQNRPWKPDVLLKVMRAATPEFRALLTGYLLTVQRGGDVTRFSPSQYDAEQRTLTVEQSKTGEALVLHVPGSLAKVLDHMKGQHNDRLFLTPRGQPWTTANAQETLARLLGHLGLERYTLHGLRATGPVALKLLGFENRAIRALTGHTSDANLEVYLRGVDHYPLARQAQEALEQQFSALLEEAEDGANTRRFAGVTGRAAVRRRE